MAVIESIKEKAGMLKGKAGVLLSSVGDLNKMAIDKMEEVSKMNLSAAGYYSELGIKQMRAVTSIKDLDSLRKFTADSISLSGEVAKKMLDDSKSWMGVGADVKDKITDMFTSKDEVASKKKVAKAAA
ncbi:MAG: phasin family protein [Spongiibacteraceae bacterium]